jgi:hypothetical protein
MHEQYDGWIQSGHRVTRCAKIVVNGRLFREKMAVTPKSDPGPSS